MSRLPAVLDRFGTGPLADDDLESARTARERRRLVIAYLCLVYLVQGRWVFGPLGGIGQPAVLFSMLLLALTIAAPLMPGWTMPARLNPVRVALLALVVHFVASSALAEYGSPSDVARITTYRDLLLWAGLVGLAWYVSRWMSVLDVDRVSRVVVGLATFTGLLGILQAFGIDLVETIPVPGLSLTNDINVSQLRSGLFRSYGTSLHPIEFSVVSAAVLPLAIHHAQHQRFPRKFVLAALVLFVSSLLSVSRTAVIGLVVALLVSAVTWSPRQRTRAFGVGGVASVGIYLAFPGLLGTLRQAFVSVNVDTSVAGRTEDFPFVVDLINQRPAFGIGFGMYSPVEYRLLDNELFQIVIELGFVGAAIFFGLLGLVVRTARRVGDDFLARGDVAGRNLSQALIAVIAVVMVSTLTFDTFFYRIALSLMFLAMGSIGALWDGVADDDQPSLPTTTREHARA